VGTKQSNFVPIAKRTAWIAITAAACAAAVVGYLISTQGHTSQPQTEFAPPAAAQYDPATAQDLSASQSSTESNKPTEASITNLATKDGLALTSSDTNSLDQLMLQLASTPPKLPSDLPPMRAISLLQLCNSPIRRQQTFEQALSQSTNLANTPMARQHWLAERFYATQFCGA
jgi:hypothetical protein